ncbi:nSTAND3 domain-containing NTPase [Bosea thiooxidans]
MSAHDFSRLSALDFEELVHDLLQAQWNKPLEAFKTGADQGIDLRYAPAEAGATIIQCKHYLKTGFSGLRSALKSDELPKIRRLAPSRYVLVTTVSLSPQEKQLLLNDLSPFVKSTNDIVGNEGIEALLRAHPGVEKTHYKLWLTSTAVMERIVHAAEACKTEFRLEKIIEKLPLYVQGGAYPKALNILQNERVVIVSGEPGIGKTTLAEMLIYAHLEDGFVPAVIESEVGEGRKVFHKSRKTIFYFDDFLGQTYLGDRLDYTGRNQDLALVEFIEMVRNSESRFILTTREHILSGALQRSERLTQSALIDHKCVLQLSDYTRIQRARILYNHIFFSDMADKYKRELVQDDFFLNVVDHRHFNPRIIDWITSVPRLKGVAENLYRQHVMAVVNDPTAIWRHAFENQISSAARYVLLAQYTLGASPSMHEVQRAWESLFDFAARKYNFGRQANEFRNAVKELTGSFLVIRGHRVNFLNPSIRDYVAYVFACSEDYVKDIRGSAQRMKQLQSLYELGKSPNYRHVRNWLTDDLIILNASIRPLLAFDYYRYHHYSGGRVEVEYFELSNRQQVIFIISLAENCRSREFVDLLVHAIDFAIDKWTKSSIDIPDAMAFLYQISEMEWLMANGGGAQVARLEDIVLDAAPKGKSGDWLAIFDNQSEEVLASERAQKVIDEHFSAYLTNGLELERDNCGDASDLSSMIDNLESIQARYDVDLTSQIDELNDLLRDREREEEVMGGSGSTDVPAVEATPVAPSATNDELRQMFMSLE